jgi:hypothetical protein
MSAKTIVQEAREPAPTDTPAPAASRECAHHWVIASPNGAMSLGRCKICGSEKEFPNSAEDGLWQRDEPQSRWTGRSEMKSWNEGF